MQVKPSHNLQLQAGQNAATVSTTRSHQLCICAYFFVFLLGLTTTTTSTTDAFSMVETTRFKLDKKVAVRSKSELFSILDGNNNKNDGDGEIDFKSFNPLSYKVSNAARGSGPTSRQIISLRQTRMQQLNRELLDAVGDERETQEILQSNKDFLLEPLEDMDAVLDPDSVYTPGMSREERYQAFRKSMDERLEMSKNYQVKSILRSMRDFVLSFE